MITADSFLLHTAIAQEEEERQREAKGQPKSCFAPSGLPN